MKSNLYALWIALLAAGLAGCGGEKPSVEQENPNYRGYLSDSRAHPTDSASPADDGLPVAHDATSPIDIVGQDTTAGPDLPGAPDYLPADVGCIPGSLCYEQENKIMGSLVSVILDEQAYNPDYFLFDILPPASKTITFTVKSNGFNQLKLVDVFLAAGGNPAITMEWASPGLPDSLPLVLFPGESVTGKLHYTPNASTPSTPSLFTIWSSDPDHLARTIVLKPKEQGPDIELPVSAVNFGCGSYCFAQEFTIENAGNQDLVIQSVQFQKSSGEWSAQGPGTGTVLKPSGTPGYAPLPLTVDYCDVDGDYTNDSNVYQIFTNDPDENPASIHLNVMLPTECP